MIDEEAPVLEPLLPSSLWAGELVPVRVWSMGQIDLFENC